VSERALSEGLFALTISACIASAASGQARVSLTIELDPALRMGPRVRTILPVRIHREPRVGVYATQNFTRSIGAAFWNRPFIYWSDGTYDGPTILGTAARVEEAPEIYAVRAAPERGADIATEALREGRYQEAIGHYQIAAGGDPATTRALIIALEGAGRTGEAARVLLDCIRGAEPREVGATLKIDRDAATGEAGEVRRMRRLAVRYIEETDDPAGEVLLASHLLTLGRAKEAFDAVGRAGDLGLDEALLRTLVEALRPAGDEPPSP